jgi:urease accessory protein
MRDDSDNRRDTAPPAPGFSPELLVWFSPSFPTGAFAYSQGLETAVAAGYVEGRAALADWLATLMHHGFIWSDLVIVSLAWRADASPALAGVADLSVALQVSAERTEETLVLGRNFRDALEAGWPEVAASLGALDDGPLPYPIAVGRACRVQGLALEQTLEAYAHAFVSNAISAAIRLSVIGQFDGQRVHADLFPLIQETAARAAVAAEDDVAAVPFAADIFSMQHETLKVRLFRS